MSTLEAQGIVEMYCKAYGLIPEDLKVISNRSGRVWFRRRKTIDGIHVDYMRMCLSHFFSNSGFGPSDIARLVGYKTHSAVIHWKEKVSSYIQNKDVLVYPYWLRLQELISVKGH